MSDPDIQTLLDDCHSGDAERQIYALLKLVELHATAAVPAIMLLLSSPDADVRAESAEALGILSQGRSEQGGSALLPLLTDTHAFVRSEAVEALGALHYTPASASIVQLLQSDPDWTVRASAAETLGLFQEPSVLPDVERALYDEEESVQTYAAYALGLIASSTFLPTLASHLAQEQAPEVRRALLAAGYRLGASEYGQPLLDLLNSADEDSAPGILNEFQDLVEWKQPVSLPQDTPRLRQALAALAQRIPLYQPHAEMIIDNLERLQKNRAPEPCIDC